MYRQHRNGETVSASARPARRWTVPSPTEKVYTILSGELTVIIDGKETILKAMDSCFIGPNEMREIVNRGNAVVTMLVAVSAPPK